MNVYLLYLKNIIKSVDEYYRDPEKCESYHRCWARSQHAQFWCGPGTVFNTKFNVCDHNYNVNCDSKPNFVKTTKSTTLKPKENVEEKVTVSTKLINDCEHAQLD
ncbi:hypothetical protein B4U80_14078 [Leptotrombidium deliense]|uniref:Chitin-binding type-2 domain-containing protein n=1 Tax=Leptotrombidium deliense TaxID=299467 RepID=A0A443S3D5_9ACAR|nr:hypothetical protein B4U80_14078 [Leptotrombidium deliense]